MVGAVLVACETAPVVDLGEPVTQGGVSVTLNGYELSYLELETSTGAELTNDPVLLLNIDVTNTSAAPLPYDLGWNAPATTQAQAPLLFMFLGEDAASSVTAANEVSQVGFGDRTYLGDPVTELISIGPGETLSDVLVYRVPQDGTGRLVLSIPPSVFGPEISLPGYIAFGYTPPTVQVPTPSSVEEAINGDTFTFMLTSTYFGWVDAEHIHGGVGYGSGALFQLFFEVTNTSDQPITYTPIALTTSPLDLPELNGSMGVIPLAQFGSDVIFEGRLSEETIIPPSETISDHYLFMPPTSEGTLHLTVPGKRLGGSGLVRVDIPFTMVTPPEPEDLTLPPTPTPGEEED